MGSRMPHLSRRAALGLGIGSAAAIPVLGAGSPAQAETVPLPTNRDATSVLQAAINRWTYLEIPAGTYTIDTVYVPSGHTIVNHGTINGTIRVVGTTRHTAGIFHTNRVNGTGSLKAGASILPGSFSGFNVGDFVLVGLQGSGNARNESGYDFVYVTEVSSAGLTVDRPLRWEYINWYIAKVVGTRVAGDLPRGTSKIAGDFTALFKKGDVVRVENLAGNDNPWVATATPVPPLVDTAYFELVRVKSVDSIAIVFEQEIAYTHKNVCLVKMDAVSNVRISGGYISRVLAIGADTLAVEDLRCSLLSVNYSIGLHIDNIRADGDTTRVCGFTAIRDGAISNIVVRGAIGSTDNAAFKMMSPINVIVNGVSTFDTVSSSTTQGIYPCFIDFFYTPYCGWAQSTVINGVSASRPKAGVPWSFWAVGTRDCRFSDITAQGGIRLTKSSRINASGLRAAGALHVEESVDGAIVTSFSAGHVNLLAVTDTVLSDGIIDGPPGANDNKAVKVSLLKGKLSQRVTLNNIRSVSANPASTSVYIEQAREIGVIGCADRPDAKASVELGDNVEGVRYGDNFFLNPVETSA